jgi:hypothetical protein
VGFGELDTGEQIRLLVPSATGVVIGLQLIFGSFLLGITTLKVNRAPAAFIDHVRVELDDLPAAAAD